MGNGFCKALEMHIGATGFKVGDYVRRMDGKGASGKVIGYAVGDYGRECLVVDRQGGNGWKTYLLPVEAAECVLTGVEGDFKESARVLLQRALDGNCWPSDGIPVAVALLESKAREEYGRGECHPKPFRYAPDGDLMECGCGCVIFDSHNYCPKCGAKETERAGE